MEIEHIIIYLTCAALLALSVYLIPNQAVKASIAWQREDHKQLKSAISYIWAGIIFAFIVIQNYGK